jgi:hypothetical protein
MNPKSRTTHCMASLLAVSLLMPAAPAFAQAVPSDVSDLVGARAAGGETTLAERGYVNHHAAKTDTASYTYWWSQAKKQCIRVQTDDGRYARIAQVSNSDCNQKDAESGPSTGAKVALAAAAALGVAALAHKSHHRNDKNYDERQTADFERGYRDALYNNSYHNYGNSREYSEGYTAGAAERGEQSSYRNGSYNRGGYQSHVDVSDIRFRDTGYAWGALERKGFKLAGERKLKGDRYQWYYWNQSTRQCVDIRTRSSQVESVLETGAWACDN